MSDILHDPSVAAVGPVGSEGGRSPSTHSTAAVVPAGGLAPGQRWSVGRKREVVLRLLRGESAESLSRALGVPLYRREGWRERALSGIDGSLREREGDAVRHVARRKELYEKLHPETKHGGDRKSAGARSSSQNENLKAFVADIAVKTGKGRSTVARDVTRAKKVAVLDDIAGTCLDKGDEIDALGKLPEGDNTRPLIHTQPLPHTLKTISPCSHRLSGELV
jgi:hypothetical protein